jgi:hypothetical protein
MCSWTSPTIPLSALPDIFRTPRNTLLMYPTAERIGNVPLTTRLHL